jgi:hypothetical protein
MDDSQHQLRFNHATSKHIVTKSKKLALAKIDYTTNDHKIWNGLLGLINPLAEYKNGIEIALTRSEVAELTGINISNVSAACDKASDNFMNAKFEVRSNNPKSGEGEFEKLNLVQKASYRDGIFLVILTPLASQELLNLSKYGSFDIEHQKKIKSRYAMVMMDILTVNWNRKGRKWQEITIPVNHLKWQFGLSDEKGEEYKKTYKGIRELRRRVIATAVTELNGAGDFIVPENEIRYIKKNGNAVTDIVFVVSRYEKVKTTDSVLDYEMRLKTHGLTASQTEEILILAKKSWFCLEKTDNEITDFIGKSINYVESKSPKNFFSYFKKAIAKAYAFIPDWASPYSDIYKNAQPLLRQYVDQRLAPDFIYYEAMFNNEISKLDTVDIRRNGAYSDYFKHERESFINQRLKATTAD